MPVFVLTGPVHCGKTTFVESAAALWKSSGLDVGGFLSRMLRDGDTIAGYDLADLDSGSSIPYLRRGPEGDAPAAGPYRICPGALETVRRILARDVRKDIVIVDEIGPLEMAGNGSWTALTEALGGGARCLCVVRSSILESFLKKLGGEDVRIVRFGKPGGLESLTADVLGMSRSAG
jgi:nucleoside-triphosphatase THEP1